VNQLLDLTNQRFGMLICLRRVPAASRTKWLCRCTGCGRLREVLLDNLRQGRSLSCGACGTRKKHGHARLNNRSPYYHLWHRINNPNRGKVCPEWRGPGSFPAFLADVLKTIGPKPKDKGVRFIRINPDQPWHDSNIAWDPPPKPRRRKKRRKSPR
jgi:transcription elongation factor Elf1